MPPAVPRNDNNPKVPSGTTAGAIITKESTRLPLMGKFRIWSLVTTCETPVLVCSTRGVASVTRTLVWVAATWTWIFRPTFWPTSTSIPLASQGAKPSAFTDTAYPADGTRDGALNMPASLLTRFRRIPFSSLLTTTGAFGILAPVESLTVPEIAPMPATVWANTGAAARMAMEIDNSSIFFMIRIPTRGKYLPEYQNGVTFPVMGYPLWLRQSLWQQPAGVAPWAAADALVRPPAGRPGRPPHMPPRRAATGVKHIALFR